MTEQFGLKESTIQSIQTFLRSYPQVDTARLYGSRAIGIYKIGSDIDRTLHVGPVLTLSVLFKIMDDIDELHVPYMLDPSIYHTIRNCDLLDHINRVDVVFYDRYLA